MGPGHGDHGDDLVREEGDGGEPRREAERERQGTTELDHAGDDGEQPAWVQVGRRTP